MKRRLVKQGNGALTITLPYKWLYNNNLRKGDYIDILESGKDLVLSTQKDLVDKEQQIEISRDRPFFKRYLKSCYILGCDRIHLSSDERLPLNPIRQSLKELIGFEIVDQSSKKCTIAIIAKSEENDLRVIMRRMFHMISSMFDEMIEAYHAGKSDELKDLISIEESVNSFANLCLRILNKKGYPDFKKTQYVYQIIVGLEQIGDALRDLTTSLSSLLLSANFNKGKDQEFLNALRTLKQYYDDFSSQFFKYDMRKISKIKKERNTLYSESKALIISYPVQTMYFYQMLSILHQLEIALNPLNA